MIDHRSDDHRSISCRGLVHARTKSSQPASTSRLSIDGNGNARRNSLSQPAASVLKMPRSCTICLAWTHKHPPGSRLLWHPAARRRTSGESESGSGSRESARRTLKMGKQSRRKRNREKDPSKNLPTTSDAAENAAAEGAFVQPTAQPHHNHTETQNVHDCTRDKRSRSYATTTIQMLTSCLVPGILHW